MSYPNQINILEGEQVEIPFTGTLFNQNTFGLVKYSDQASVIRNCFDKAVFSKKDGFENGVVVIKGLEDGNYTIKLHQLNISIALVVHKGVYWLTDSFILKQYSLVEARENQSFIRVSNVRFEEEKKEADNGL